MTNYVFAGEIGKGEIHLNFSLSLPENFVLLTQFSSKNTKSAAENPPPPFWGNVGAKIKFGAPQINLVCRKSVVVRRNIATFCPQIFLTHDAAG